MDDDEEPFLTETNPATGVASTVAKGSSEILQYLTKLYDRERHTMNQDGALEQALAITAQFPALSNGVAGASSQAGMCVMGIPGNLYAHYACTSVYQVT